MPRQTKVSHSPIVLQVHKDNHLNLTNVRDMIGHHMEVLRKRLKLVDSELSTEVTNINQALLEIRKYAKQLSDQNEQTKELCENLEQRFEQYIAEQLMLEERAAFRNRIAYSTSLLLVGCFVFVYSIMLLALDKEFSPKLTLLGIALATAGVFLSNRETVDAVQNFVGNVSGFFKRTENKSSQTAGKFGNVDDVRQLTLTTNASIQMLARSSNEAIVTLKDEVSKTTKVLRGTGRDVAKEIQTGIKNGNFKPQADVDVVIRDNYATVCLVM